jgi:hypothetical protein
MNRGVPTATKFTAHAVVRSGVVQLAPVHCQEISIPSPRLEFSVTRIFSLGRRPRWTLEERELLRYHAMFI